VGSVDPRYAAAAARAELVEEISLLRRQLAHAEARLARAAPRGPGTSGLVWGFLLGMLIAGAMVVGLFFWLMEGLSHAVDMG
jgi:hypothetical protein